MEDKRYKVSRGDVERMRQLRGAGMTYSRIADEIGGIAWQTVYYWCNDDQREKQRKKNAKRRYSKEENKKRVARDMRKRKLRWEFNPDTKLAHEIRSALSDKRSNRKTVRGIPIKEAKELLESGALNMHSKKLGNIGNTKHINK